MKLLFIMTAAPHGSVAAQEGLDALLMGSAFTECAVLFSGAGLLQLLNSQEPADLAMKDFARGFAALRDYGVNPIYVRSTDLSRYGLSVSDLIIEVETLDDNALPALLASYDKVVNF